MRGRWRKCKKHEQQKKSILRNELFQVKKTSFNEASYRVYVCERMWNIKRKEKKKWGEGQRKKIKKNTVYVLWQQ